MISNLLLAAEPVNHPVFLRFSPRGILVLFVYAFFVCLIIIAVVMFIRFLGSGIREMKLMRMEVGKLAEELRLLRQELKGRKRSSSSVQ